MNKAEATLLVESVLNDVWLARDIETLGTYYKRDFIGYIGTDEIKYVDLENRIRFMQKHQQEIQFEIESILAEGNQIAYRFKHSCLEDGIAKKTNIMAMYEISEGKIAKLWAYCDQPFDYRAQP